MYHPFWTKVLFDVFYSIKFVREEEEAFLRFRFFFQLSLISQCYLSNESTNQLQKIIDLCMCTILRQVSDWLGTRKREVHTEN